MSRGFPRAVHEAPLLRGLDARALAELESAGALTELAEGARLYEAGTRGDAFYVVARGALELSAARPGDGVRERARTARVGDHAGAEVVLSLPREHDAIALEPSAVAEIPAHLFRRVARRSGGGALVEALERMLRRTATLELLATSPLGRRLDPAARDVVVDAARFREVERGASIYRQGEPSGAMYLVLDGLVQIQTVDEDGRAHVRAYLRRGDFFGDRELETASPRREQAVASGPTTLLELPARTARGVMEAHGELFRELRRVEDDGPRAEVREAAALTTRHAFRDLYRLGIARSLLVIDQDQCVRCGHCTWACGSLHGVPRMTRRGDTVTTRLRVLDDAPSREGGSFDVFRLRAEDLAAPRPLLLPNSCQHCEHPACMIDCPTGAIARDPDGEVHIREALCTGCGACARACPWDNIHLAPRAPGATRPEGVVADVVATKCDLCRGREAGPGCVEACPVGAVLRVDPSSDFEDVRAALGPAPRGLGGLVAGGARARAGAWLTGAALASTGLGAAGIVLHARGALQPGAGLGLAAGALAGALLLALAGYELPKRGALLLAARRRARRGATEAPQRVRAAPTGSKLPGPRASYVLHLALGLASVAAVLVHAPLTPPSADSGALALAAFALAALTGVGAALVYALVPRRLSRVEASALLPEDHARAAEQLERRLFRELSGRTELVKKIAASVLLPYARAPLGPLALLASGRDLREERRRLRALLDRRLEGRGAGKLDGLDELIRAAVEQRALPAQRLASAALRAVVPAHVVCFALALLTALLHAALAMRGPS